MQSYLLASLFCCHSVLVLSLPGKSPYTQEMGLGLFDTPLPTPAVVSRSTHAWPPTAQLGGDTTQPQVLLRVLLQNHPKSLLPDWADLNKLH